VEMERTSLLNGVPPLPQEKIAFHPPCSLQHGQQIRGATEKILRAAGIELTPVPDVHLCCGSAGTYSILQPALSDKLRANKLAALGSGGPRRILSSNIGCLSHLAATSAIPVEHWIEYLDRRQSAA
jgi:glycolate oxidase iron-sulfur subunit